MSAYNLAEKRRTTKYEPRARRLRHSARHGQQEVATQRRRDAQTLSSKSTENHYRREFRNPKRSGEKQNNNEREIPRNVEEYKSRYGCPRNTCQAILKQISTLAEHNWTHAELKEQRCSRRIELIRHGLARATNLVRCLRSLTKFGSAVQF